MCYRKFQIHLLVSRYHCSGYWGASLTAITTLSHFYLRLWTISEHISLMRPAPWFVSVARSTVECRHFPTHWVNILADCGGTLGFLTFLTSFLCTMSSVSSTWNYVLSGHRRPGWKWWMWWMSCIWWRSVHDRRLPLTHADRIRINMLAFLKVKM